MSKARNDKLRYLSTTLSNLGVIGIGLAMWQGGDWWSWFGGVMMIFAGYKLIGQVVE